MSALLLVLGVVSGCSGLAGEAEFRPVDGPDPSYRQMVANLVRSNFKNPWSYTTFEISEVRWVHAVSGWSWLACVRFQDQGRRRTYAVFIKEKRVVDSRFAVVTDACDAVAYEPLELPPGTAPAAGVGQLSPLY